MQIKQQIITQYSITQHVNNAQIVQGWQGNE